ncbi:hypothetical protein MmiHf6_01580 [Methanimicrococcus hongohii]|uniref:Uncharacterized protein n=1 Tax=Methanimicrococcus hongohii TaxID=3028295 RepID=A0AA96UYS8_9EURY|nr:hypothetical protein [Methanimicrococcus sp. Hf6]WNY22870.1 hypothetical protein MmiHf6_01580 [Methanimicrococcus sp. Hf6]
MQEHSDLSVEIYDLLKDGRQLSISGITRELKSRNFNEHRLIVTGYLRALKDMDCLNEFDLSPSKIYTLKTDGKGANAFSISKSKTSGFAADSETCSCTSDVYGLVGDKLSKMTSPATKIETAVYIFMTLFDRPCFESELNAAGVDSNQLSKYFAASGDSGDSHLVFKSKDFKKYYDELPQIPKNSPAYEIHTDKLDSDFLMRAVNILSALLKDEIDVSELVSKTANTSLLDF